MLDSLASVSDEILFKNANKAYKQIKQMRLLRNLRM